MKKFLFLINVIVVVITLFVYLFITIPPSKQGVFMGVTLFFPALLIANFLFLIFWVVKLDKRAIVSFVILFLGFKQITRLFAFNFPKSNTHTTSIKLSTYNVKFFFNQRDGKNLKKENCFSILNQNDVDLIGIQETHMCPKSKEYEFNNCIEKSSQSKLYTKKEFKNFKSLNLTGIPRFRKDFSYVDIILNGKPIRVFSAHFFSYHFYKDPEKLKKAGPKDFMAKLRKTLKIHETETNLLVKEIKNSPYPVIVMGDFNNNAFSYEYNTLIKECHLKDTFVEAGFGFGATYNFKYFPTRIDYILVPINATVHSHKVLSEVTWSDHYPVMAEISFP